MAESVKLDEHNYTSLIFDAISSKNLRRLRSTLSSPENDLQWKSSVSLLPCVMIMSFFTASWPPLYILEFEEHPTLKQDTEMLSTYVQSFILI